MRFAEAFYIGATEVTFAQYDAFAEATDRALPADNGWGRGSLPVINVSWSDAGAYANWVGEMTGATCRLPSEAEWEYACRAGTTTPYSLGDEMGDEQANVAGAVGKTTEVGSYLANPWSLFDMHGNVLEWAEDCWHGNYDWAPDDGTAWFWGTGGAGSSWWILAPQPGLCALHQPLRLRPAVPALLHRLSRRVLIPDPMSPEGGPWPCAHSIHLP